MEQLKVVGQAGNNQPRCNQFPLAPKSSIPTLTAIQSNFTVTK
jgi:hypothetical protein